jgi:hypothetical protein
VLHGIGTIAANLNTILHKLHRAEHGSGHRAPRSIGMNYYDPFLAYWLTGGTGKLVAAASVGLLGVINATEHLEYASHGFAVANVFHAFRTADFAPSAGRRPVNVATLCRLTYMCTQHNIHPTTRGYRVIARAFQKRLHA